MNTANVNVNRNEIRNPRKISQGTTERTSAGFNIGDNLFTLMLVAIASFGIWAATAVLLL